MYNQPIIDEEILLRQLIKGDQNAFSKIYDGYIHIIYQKIFFLVKSNEIAEEITQDVFLKIWEKRTDIDPLRPFLGYLISIAKNKVTDFYRRLSLDQKMQRYFMQNYSELYDPIENHYSDVENKQMIAQAMDALSPQRRLVFSLIKIDGKSYSEVSELLGIGNSTIRDHIVKATKVVKASILQRNKLYLFIALLPDFLFFVKK